MVVSNVDTETCLRKLLEGEGFSMTPMRAHGETGVDILASKPGEEIHIEVIGYKKTGPARAKDFYEAFFRAISRLKDGARRCVIAVPHLAEVGLPARARQYGFAWTRIGRAFPELDIWLIDTVTSAYRKTSWNEWGT